MAGRVVHCRREAFDVYIGRPSPLGNPFSHLPEALERDDLIWVPTREEAIARYLVWVTAQPILMSEVAKLGGKTLGCWCSPLPCHGDVLIALANNTQTTLNG